MLKTKTSQLLIVITLALLIRVAFLCILNPNGIYFTDTRHYDRAAKQLVAGEGFGEQYNRSPMYPVIMAGVYMLFGPSFTAMRLFEIIAGLALIWVIYQIGIRLFDHKRALIAAGLAAVFPHFVLITGILYSTNIFTLFLALTTLLLLNAEEQGEIGYYALAGLTAGVSALTIPCIFFIFPFWLLWLLLSKNFGCKARLLHVVSFAVLFALVLTPWTMNNYQKYGRFTLVRMVPHTVFPDLEQSSSNEKEIESGFAETTDYLKSNPTGTDDDSILKIARNYAMNPVRSVKFMLGEMKHFWALYPDRLDMKDQDYLSRMRKKDSRVVPVARFGVWRWVKALSIAVMLPVFLLAILGLITDHPFEHRTLLMMLTIFSMAAGYSLIAAEVRYRIPVEPYILLFTAQGIYFLLKSKLNPS
ncbi:MAG: glycosyltransferase family 39 protein [candidate division KSB1 bacterium]|nr:glycosyltransferase family 39 protein [candidate division KSB1 bacterium]